MNRLMDSCKIKIMDRQEINLMLAEGLKRSMKINEFEKVRVGDICEQSGVSRQTFYRHFKDKYDLLNWYFGVILNNSFKHMGQGSTLHEALVKKLTYIKEERLFFTQAFKYGEQNNLKDHDYELIYSFYKNKLTQTTNQLLPSNIDFILQMYCQGSVFMTVQWLINGCQESVLDMVDNLIQAMPIGLSDYFKQSHLI